MSDLDMIRENYARMSDGQLQHLAQHEGAGLTEDALKLLRYEFNLRQLDTAVFDTIDAAKQPEKDQSVQETSPGQETTSTGDLLGYLWVEKENGRTNAELLEELKARGVGEESARSMLMLLKTRAKENYDAHTSNMIRGGVFCLIGLAVTAFTYASAMNGGGSYVVAWGAIIFGGIRFFSGLSSREKYKTIVANTRSDDSLE